MIKLDKFVDLTLNLWVTAIKEDKNKIIFAKIKSLKTRTKYMDLPESFFG